MRTGSVKSRVALAVGAFIVVVILGKGCVEYMKVGSGPDARWSRTVFALNRFQGYLTDYKIVHRSLPGPTLRDAIDALEKEGTKYHEEHGVVITQPGLDGWGRELIYEVLDPEHAVIRSVGANGIDEKGQGDDIQREVPPPDWVSDKPCDDGPGKEHSTPDDPRFGPERV